MQNSQDILITAKTIYGEARNQPLKGMIAVGFVIKNRAYFASKGVHKALYGDGSFASVCKRPWQFSCWNSNDPNKSILDKLTFEDTKTNKVFSNCYNIAKSIAEGSSEFNNPVGNSTHYYADYLDRLKMPPKWAKGLKPYIKIGNHTFYENVP